MYDRNEIVKLLKENSIDVVLLLAVWAETYSYTLTEAAIAGIPVLALPYGAIEERVNKQKLGWLLSKDATTEDVMAKLNEIFENQISMDSNGYFISDDSCKTNIPGVYVAGDCRKKLLRQIVTATSDGAIAASRAIKYIKMLTKKCVMSKSL